MDEDFTQEELQLIKNLVPMIRFTTGQSKEMMIAESIMKKINNKMKINNEMLKMELNRN